MKKHALAAAVIVLLGALAVSILVAGCGGVPEGDIATVRGEPITEEQFDKVIDQAKAQSKAQGQDFPEVGTKSYNTYAASVVEYLVSQEVINQAAEDPDFLKSTLADTLDISEGDLEDRWGKKAAAFEKPVVVTEKAINKQVKALVTAYGGKKKVKALLKQQGMTWKDLHDAIRDQIVDQKVYNRVIAAAQVTPKQIKKYYEKHKDEYDQEETRKVRHILVKTKAEALKVRALLVADPSTANWKKVAKEYSTDSGTADSGGSLGDVTPDMMVPAFDKATFSLKLKQISQPVKTSYGWHVIQVTKITPAKKSTLKESTKEIRETLLSTAQSKLWENWLKTATSEADVKYADGYDPSELKKAKGKATKSASPSPSASESSSSESASPSPSASE